MYMLPMTNKPAAAGFLPTKSGVTLIELMVSVMLLSIGIMVSILSFGGIQKSIQLSKGRTLAANIAQEKMQVIMQKSYYEVLVTTSPQFKVDASTTVIYDPGYFPPETIPEGGMTFTRYTYIQPVIENSGNIQAMPPTTPDTGMRQITITVIWPTDSGNRILSVQNVLNNPNTVMSNSVLQGVVKDFITAAPIANAVVNAAENVGWRDTTSSSGDYSINLSPGSFDFQASALGYYSQIATLTLAPNGSTTHTFYLKAISTGTIQGSAWIMNHPVISQIVASTGPSNGVEYVELYNPTTAPYMMGTNAGYLSPSMWTVDFDAANNTQPLALVYISTTIPSNGFYLISNTGDGLGSPSCASVVINGTTVNPDACWHDVGMPKHALQCNPIVANGCASSQNAGGFGIGTNGGQPWTGLANTTKYDAIAWTGHGFTPNSYETAPAASAANGMGPGETFVRRLDTTTAWNTSFGNSYDSGNNSVDFIDYANPQFPPRTSATIKPPLTETPAPGAIASVTDGISTPSPATLTGNPPYAQFTVPGIATGTWIVFVDSGSWSAEIDNVAVTANSTTTIPNAITSPSWLANGANDVALSTLGVVGMISGKVTDALGSSISGGISVTAGNTVAITNANGMYFLRLSTGIYDVIANPGNGNAFYASMTMPGVSVTLGDVTANVNYQLSQGGRINGWISRDGVNPLPGVTVVAFDTNGVPRDNEVSGSNGYFMLINLTTGTYSVQPVLDAKETSSPTSAATAVTAGNTVWSSSFTVIGAMGSVTGAVTVGGQSINSGVLIVASTGAISMPLPALSSATLTAAVMYAESSREDGTYSMDIRGSTTSVYNMTAFYTTLAGQLPVTSTRTITGITVTAGQTTSGVNFAW